MYADDATYQVTSKKREQNQMKFDENAVRIQEFMNNNELTMNLGKMTLTECMLKQKKGRTLRPPPVITVETGTRTTKDKGTCRILGQLYRLILHGSNTWRRIRRHTYPQLGDS